jgi:hypothetical protein
MAGLYAQGFDRTDIAWRRSYSDARAALVRAGVVS